ncbi:hypothetical protein HPB47_020637 [Ixodes persulcatus]|uniref:Uncharacterized protein n=1 Tax=Ixodes persulcatus TaxID=34615 RepID=A0AC60QGU4_IXOPE|nr:hypothetical protein HPB47_020637 [Ixodes persulcatus]
MHLGHHPDRRKARSAAHHKQYGQLEGVVYTDAADYPPQKAMTMVATDGHGVPLSGGSIPTTNSETAKEVAIAIALLVINTQAIISDSKRAILNFARGRVSEATLRVLKRISNIPNDMVSLIWAPAYTSLPGNEAAHTTARELAYRAQGAMAVTGNEPVSHRDTLTSYQEITQSYRLARRKLPAGQKSLTKSQEWTWRRLQTNTYPNPALYSHWLPDLHSELGSGHPEGNLRLGRGSRHGLGFATLPLFCFIVENYMGWALDNTWPSLHCSLLPPHARTCSADQCTWQGSDLGGPRGVSILRHTSAAPDVPVTQQEEKRSPGCLGSSERTGPPLSDPEFSSTDRQTDGESSAPPTLEAASIGRIGAPPVYAKSRHCTCAGAPLAGIADRQQTLSRPEALRSGAEDHRSGRHPPSWTVRRNLEVARTSPNVPTPALGSASNGTGARISHLRL